MSRRFAVVVTWNGVRWVSPCLGSLRASTEPVRIVVVDNASTDDTVARVRNEFPEATCVTIKENLGFGRANNIGIRYAYDQGAEHVFLLNQDAWVEPNALSALVHQHEIHTEYGILSPLHLTGEGQSLDRLFSAHLSKAGDSYGLLSDALFGRALKPIYDFPFINAAAWLVSRKCIESVGLFNPVFRHYGEDMEYASRVRHLGLRIGVVPAARAYHGREDRDNLPPNTARAIDLDRAMLRYRLARHAQPTKINLLSAMSHVCLAGVPAGPLHRRWKHRLALLGSLLTELPRLLKERKRSAVPGKCFFPEADADVARYVT